MNIANVTAPPAPSGEAPNIHAMPTPTAEETLLIENQKLVEQVASLSAENKALTTRCDKLVAQCDDLATQVKDLEKNPFTFALNNMDAGAVLATAGNELKRLSAIVRERDAKGSFTFRITVKPFKAGALVLEPEIKVSEPKAEATKSVFYSDEEGSLSRNDPKQRELPLPYGDRGANAEDRALAHERRNPDLR